MSSSSDQIFEDAIAQGIENKHIVGLARNHCTHMTFTESGGQGYAEVATGLPINSRRVHCDYVADSYESSNLRWIATSFYESHCEGCEYRAPTGDMPTLGSEVEGARAAQAAAEAAEREARERAHADWEARDRARQAAAVGADLTMTGALADLAALDTDPVVDSDRTAATDALRRLEVLAERSPGLFSDPVINHSLELARAGHAPDLLGPLRHIARTREDLRSRVSEVACGVLQTGPHLEGARCVVELRGHIDPAALDQHVMRSLVLLAAAPARSSFGQLRDVAGEPAGLQIAADLAPDGVIEFVSATLVGPDEPSGLIIPPGTRQPPAQVTDMTRAASAGAVRVLAATHPTIAEALIGALLRNLAVDDANRYEHIGVSRCQSTLATLIVHRIGDVPAALEAIGSTASEELRKRMFGVYERLGRLLDPEDRWRQGDEPAVEADRRSALLATLTAVAVRRLGGDWGHDIGSHAAVLLEQVAKRDAAWATSQLEVILGTLLDVVDQLLAPEPDPGLHVIAEPDPLAAMRAASQRMMLGSTAHRLAELIEIAGNEAPLEVVSRVIEVIDEQRDAIRGADVIWRLLPVLGAIGRRHGTNTDVLSLILPTVHTYLVDAEPSLRAEAIKAWTEIGTAYPLPSSLADLLPVLTMDEHFVVIDALLAAAGRLDWSETNEIRLLHHALLVCGACDPDKNDKTLKSAISTVGKLTREREDWRPVCEQTMVDYAGRLDGHALQDVLRRTWLPEIEHSGALAQLRFRQVCDESVIDRYNQGDDEELCALLRSGPGLRQLGTQDLLDAAVGFVPDNIRGALDLVEVCWRAGRLDDTVALIRAVLAAIPDVPAYAWQQRTFRLLLVAAEADLAAVTGADLEPLNRAIGDTPWVPEEDDELGRTLTSQTALKTAMRCVMLGDTVPASLAAPVQPATDPAEMLRARATVMSELATELAAVAVRVTPSAELVRVYGGLAEAAAHLLRADAAELDADVTQVGAYRTAAQRRAETLLDQIGELAPDDPIGGPLRNLLGEITSLGPADRVRELVARCATVPLPPLIVNGPRPIQRGPTPPAPAPEPEPHVAVVLCSIDGRLITGPQSLRPGLVYDLRFEIWPGEWPDWAEQLDCELISHLTPTDIQTPKLSLPRPVDRADSVEGSGSLVLHFGLAAGQPAPPFRIALRWRGTQDNEPVVQRIDVAGHRELRLRPFDASRDYLTDYPVFDARLLELYERFRGAGYDEDHIQAFCRLFTATCRVALRVTWDKRYKRGTRVTEAQFHDDLFDALKAEPELEGRLDRGTALGLGYLDVRHDGIVSELKVERRTPVTKQTAPKYMSQPTQYASADGARMSILCILDRTDKRSTVGTPENYLFTLQPALHGLDDPRYPSVVTVLVINSNLPVPSSWSRRKTKLQQTTLPKATSDPPP